MEHQGKEEVSQPLAGIVIGIPMAVAIWALVYWLAKLIF